MHSSQFHALACYADAINATVRAMWFIPNVVLDPQALVLLAHDDDTFTVGVAVFTLREYTSREMRERGENEWDFDIPDVLASRVDSDEARRAFDHFRLVWVG